MATLPGPDSAEAKLNKLMHKIYAPIVVTAFEHGLALIDLPNTFDARSNLLCAAACSCSRCDRVYSPTSPSHLPFPYFPPKIHASNRTVCLWRTPHRNSDVHCSNFVTYEWVMICNYCVLLSIHTTVPPSAPMFGPPCSVDLPESLAFCFNRVIFCLFCRLF